MIRVLAVASLLLLAAPAALAHGETTRERCDRRGGSNMELFRCFAGPRAAEDARLNRVYQALMARLKPGQRLALRDEQRAWIKDRDAECMPFYDPAQYGQQGKLDGEECMTDRTRDRADQLARIGRR
jgi:uncharacterized protein YecT (DUF1311 family)